MPFGDVESLRERVVTLEAMCHLLDVKVKRIERAVFDASGVSYAKEVKERGDAIQEQGTDEGGVQRCAGG